MKGKLNFIKRNWLRILILALIFYLGNHVLHFCIINDNEPYYLALVASIFVLLDLTLLVFLIFHFVKYITDFE